MSALYRVCDRCGHRTPGDHALDCPDRGSGVVTVAQPVPPAFLRHRERQLNEADKEIDALRSEVERLRAAPVNSQDVSSVALAQILAERDQLRAEVERLTRERDEARGYVDTAVEAAVQAANKRKAAEAERDSLSSQLADMIQLCDKKAAERDVALEERDELASRLAAYREAKHKILAWLDASRGPCLGDGCEPISEMDLRDLLEAVE